MSGLFLLAQALPDSPQGSRRDLIEILADPAVSPMVVACVAIIGGIAFAITKAVIRHRERMAMIERGINPHATDDQK